MSRQALVHVMCKQQALLLLIASILPPRAESRIVIGKEVSILGAKLVADSDRGPPSRVFFLESKMIMLFSFGTVRLPFPLRVTLLTSVYNTTVFVVFLSRILSRRIT